MKFFITIPLLLACGSLAASQQIEWSLPPQLTPTHRRVHIRRPVHDPQQRPALEAQKPASVQEPRRPQEPMQVQEKQTFHQPLAWRFPEPPVEEPQIFPPEFELKSPVPADGVAIRCGENSVHVEVKRDLLGIGKPILSSDIKLGDCAPTNQDASLAAEMFIFESELHGCGGQLMVTHLILAHKHIFLRNRHFEFCCKTLHHLGLVTLLWGRGEFCIDTKLKNGLLV